MNMLRCLLISLLVQRVVEESILTSHPAFQNVRAYTNEFDTSMENQANVLCPASLAIKDQMAVLASPVLPESSRL